MPPCALDAYQGSRNCKLSFVNSSAAPYGAVPFHPRGAGPRLSREQLAQAFELVDAGRELGS
jgi:hypothetical protein